MKNKLKAMLFAGALMFATVAAGSVTAKAETPAIKYSGTDGKVEWSIDANGHLLLTGEGDYVDNADWTNIDYRKKIKTATVKVKNMTNAEGMFYYCENLTSVDFSVFDTSKITDMGGMFFGCSSLSTLDLSNFKTHNVVKMYSMFGECSNLYKLDLSSFDTSNVEDMDGMFLYCEKLKRLDMSGFNTSKVRNMSGMFGNCGNLTSLDLDHFDTKYVKYISSMFFGCSRLKELDLGNWDLSSVTSGATMFNGASSLARITLPNLPLDIDLPYMYYDGKCNLTNVAKARQGKMTYLLAAYGDSYCYKNGHTYSLPNFTWADDYSSATVYFECTRKDCKYDVDSKCVHMDAAVTKETIQPTTEKEGATVYTATAVLKGKTYTDVKRFAIAKLPAQPTSKPIGTSFTSTNTFYRVVKAGKTPEVSYMGPKNKKVKTVTIPATVKIGGVTYKVTSIATGALKNYKNLTKVTVGKNVTKIGKSAFYGCKKLKKIVIKGKNLKTVGKNALKGIKKNTIIDVPNSKKKAYKKLFTGKTGYKKTMSVK